jgi:hypothetical protein
VVALQTSVSLVLDILAALCGKFYVNSGAGFFAFIYILRAIFSEVGYFGGFSIEKATLDELFRLLMPALIGLFTTFLLF